MIWKLTIFAWEVDVHVCSYNNKIIIIIISITVTLYTHNSTFNIITVNSTTDSFSMESSTSIGSTLDPDIGGIVITVIVIFTGK